MKTKALLFFTLLGVIANVCRSQNSPQVIPPTPTAYSLGKYGDIPVSLYTGVPNINIPIYTLTNRDASLDVSLSYHGSGIKIDEHASSVGLGWSLNAGGVITRVVKGMPEALQNNGTFLRERADIQFYNYSTNPNKTDFVYDNKLYLAITGQIDPEPDIFYFNFMGRAGKFYFDKTGKAILEKDEGLEIKWHYVAWYQEKFVIKDERGTQYEFSDYETTFLNGINQNIISAWYLSKIITPTGNQITLEYSGAASSNQLVRSYTTSFVDVLPYNTSVTPPINVPYIGTAYTEIRLLKVASENCSVHFNYKNQTRQDYPPLNSFSALDEILIKNSSGSLLKKYKLLTSYFEANNIRKYDGIDPANFAYLNYRLRLDGIQEYASDNTSAIPAYAFTYLGDNDPTSDDPYTLPYRLSPQQDHWGYYNQSANTHLIPGAAQRGFSMPEWYFQFSLAGTDGYISTAISGGANRDPDAEAMKAGMLKEIHYPTGGYTEFLFEANDYSNNLGGVRIGKIISHPVSGQSKETNYTYSGYNTYNPKDYYFEYYSVDYKYYGTNMEGTHYLYIYPRPGILQQFGVPYDLSYYYNSTKKYIKVAVQPQAILGPGSQVGYYFVTESHPGDGTTSYSYESPNEWPDYTNREVFNENSTEELQKLDNIFVSEFIDDASYPDYPTGVVMTKSLSSGQWPYPEIYSNDWKRGVLTDKIFSSSSGKVLKEEHYTYFRQLKDVIPGWKVIGFETDAGGIKGYIYSKYVLPHTLRQLKSTEIIDNDNNGLNPLTTTTEYFYDNSTHFQPTRTETISSKGEKKVQLTTYPMDYSNGTTFIDDMKTSHLLAFPIEQVQYIVNGGIINIVAGALTKYYPGGKGLKEEVLKLETTSPIALSSFKFSNRTQGTLPMGGSASNLTEDNRYKRNLIYHSYDNKGNVTSVSKENDVKTSYIWGYNKTYPVAQVIGADYATISNLITNNSVIENPPSDADLRFELNKIHSGLANTKALVTTYTYRPLVGMTSQTDANGRTTFYEYDNFGRLMHVRDQDNNILKKFCYNYKGQQELCTTNTTAQWQLTGNYRCVLDGSGQNTGYQEGEERDNNPNSTTYNQLRWVASGYNTTACPLPSACNYSNCSGQGYACIYGQCESGYRVNTDSYYDYSMGQFVCVYHYEFSDGSWSQDYYEYSNYQCPIY